MEERKGKPFSENVQIGYLQHFAYVFGPTKSPYCTFSRDTENSELKRAVFCFQIRIKHPCRQSQRDIRWSPTNSDSVCSPSSLLKSWSFNPPTNCLRPSESELYSQVLRKKRNLDPARFPDLHAQSFFSDDQKDSPTELAFKYAVYKINKEKTILPNNTLAYDIQYVPPEDSFRTTKKVTKQLVKMKGFIILHGLLFSSHYAGLRSD